MQPFIRFWGWHKYSAILKKTDGVSSFFLIFSTNQMSHQKFIFYNNARIWIKEKESHIISKYSRDCGWPRRPWPNAGRKKQKKRPKNHLFFFKKLNLPPKEIFFWSKFSLFTKKADFSDVFSAFYGQRSVMAAWATRSPWSISFLFFSVFCFWPTSGKLPCAKWFLPQHFGITGR